MLITYFNTPIHCGILGRCSSRSHDITYESKEKNETIGSSILTYAVHSENWRNEFFYTKSHAVILTVRNIKN